MDKSNRCHEQSQKGHANQCYRWQNQALNARPPCTPPEIFRLFQAGPYRCTQPQRKVFGQINDTCSGRATNLSSRPPKDSQPTAKSNPKDEFLGKRKVEALTLPTQRKSTLQPQPPIISEAKENPRHINKKRSYDRQEILNARAVWFASASETLVEHPAARVNQNTSQSRNQIGPKITSYEAEQVVADSRSRYTEETKYTFVPARSPTVFGDAGDEAPKEERIMKRNLLREFCGTTPDPEPEGEAKFFSNYTDGSERKKSSFFSSQQYGKASCHKAQTEILESNTAQEVGFMLAEVLPAEHEPIEKQRLARLILGLLEDSGSRQADKQRLVKALIRLLLRRDSLQIKQYSE